MAMHEIRATKAFDASIEVEASVSRVRTWSSRFSRLRAVVEPREIADDEVLSHYGTPGWPNTDPEEVPEGERGGFRGVPRPEKGESGMSVQIGRLTPAEMVEIMMARSPRPSDAVRHTTAGKLREAGFVVTHTPRAFHPDHATVEFPGDWTDDVTESWHDCFDSPIMYEDSDG